MCSTLATAAGAQAALQPSGIDVAGKVWPAIREATTALFRAAMPELNPRDLQLCWELLGLDFMVDAVGQVGGGASAHPAIDCIGATCLEVPG
jgi:hypothetical protein